MMMQAATAAAATPALVEVLGVYSLVPRVLITAAGGGLLFGVYVLPAFASAGHISYRAGLTPPRLPISYSQLPVEARATV